LRIGSYSERLPIPGYRSRSARGVPIPRPARTALQPDHFGHHSASFWTPVLHSVFITCLAFLSRIRGTRKRGTPAKLVHSFWTPTRLILDTHPPHFGQSLTTKTQRHRDTENSLFYHEGHEGKTKGLKQRTPVVSQCMRLCSIHWLTDRILFINFMPFMVKCICLTSVSSVNFPQSRDKTCISPLLLVPFFRFLYDFQTTFWTICPVPSGTDENSLLHHEAHEGETKGLKQRKPVVSQCMRLCSIHSLTDRILFITFMPFMVKCIVLPPCPR